MVQIFSTLKDLTQESSSSKRMLKGLFELGLSYYNPLSSKLEPVIEDTCLSLCYITGQNSNPLAYLTIELDENVRKSLNINISEEMISGLLRTYWSFEKEISQFREEFLNNYKENLKNLPYQGKLVRKNTISKKYYQDYMKYVSIYSISNETGYDLELIRPENSMDLSLNLQKSFTNNIQSKKPLKTIVKNGQIENFEVISDEKDFEKTFHKLHFISVFFKGFSNEEFTIKNIELNRIRKKRYYWNSAEKHRFFLAEIRVLGSRKNLLLSSTIVFQNNLNKKLVVLLKNPRFMALQVEVPEFKRRAVPVEYVEETGGFQIKAGGNEDYDNRSVSKNIDFFRFFRFLRFLRFSNFSSVFRFFFFFKKIAIFKESYNAEFSTTFSFSQLKTLCDKNCDNYAEEMSHFPCFSLLTVQKSSEIAEKLLISVDSSFKFYNCLPIPLEIAIFIAKSSIFEENPSFIRINPQEEYHELSICLKSEIFLILKIPGFENSKRFSVHNPLFPQISQSFHAISLKSSNSELIPDEESSNFVYIVKKSGVLGSKELFIYAKSCIINQTYHLLDFYGFDKNTVKKTRINRDFNQRKTSFSIKQIFLFNNQENLMLGFKGLSHETSNEVNISQIGSYSVELKAFNEDHYELFEFAVTVSLKKSGIFFDFFEFFKVFCIIYT